MPLKDSLHRQIQIPKLFLIAILLVLLTNFLYGLFFVSISIQTCDGMIPGGAATFEWCQEDMSLFMAWRRGRFSFGQMLILANIYMPIRIIDVFLPTAQDI